MFDIFFFFLDAKVLVIFFKLITNNNNTVGIKNYEIKETFFISRYLKNGSSEFLHINKFTINFGHEISNRMKLN